MQNKSQYNRGPGFHVDIFSANSFADKYLDENGAIKNIESEDFKTDLQVFLSSHAVVEEAYLTIDTWSIIDDLNSPGGIF